MTNNLLEEIKKKSREEWQQTFKDKWTDLRIWIQENGEIAAVAGLLLGILIVLAFKVVVGLVVLVALLGVLVVMIAEPASIGGSNTEDVATFSAESKPEVEVEIEVVEEEEKQGGGSKEE